MGKKILLQTLKYGAKICGYFCPIIDKTRELSSKILQSFVDLINIVKFEQIDLYLLVNLVYETFFNQFLALFSQRIFNHLL